MQKVVNNTVPKNNLFISFIALQPLGLFFTTPLVSQSPFRSDVVRELEEMNSSGPHTVEKGEFDVSGLVSSP